MIKTRILVVSFDGLRPDLVVPELMPNLCRLRDMGLTLANHRTVYPSETRTAFPSLVTGAPVGVHGMVGNRYLDRFAVPHRLIDTADARLLRSLDVESGGQLMSVASLGEILASAGLSLAVIATNTPGTTRLFNHKAEDLGHIRLSGHYRESCTPLSVLAQAEEHIGPLPPAPPPDEPDTLGQSWITSAFLEVVWPKHRPDATILSFGEPDITSHFHGTAAQSTRQIIAHCDHEFGRLLDWWQSEGQEAGVQIFVTSDHGHITGHTSVSVADSLREAGFHPAFQLGAGVDVLIVPGHVGALYLATPNDRQIARLVAAISSMPWCGPIFTRARNMTEGIAPGSLPHHLVFAAHLRAPDVSFSFRTDDGLDPFGLPGRTFYDNDRRTGLGLHGGLHPKEMATVGIAAGSLIQGRGTVSMPPSGICDLAPTILHMIGIEQPRSMQGRVLHEIFDGTARQESKLGVHTEAFEAKLGSYSQVLRRVRYGSRTYVESGAAVG
ncbi:alkaline phosphatase family protein [Variovorax sp. VRV01]|uniref:alkaline phosphatase family protein n=1 Tax=Variovorax sp. VRV01 TaxID=2769259 RepID=UPI001CE094DC|nr:alkaline phosphatase family protein [Variovorax sp. VRV01]